MIIGRFRTLFRFATEAPNYFKLFNLSNNFTDQQLKTAYLELVKQYHPDLSKDPKAAEMFRLVQEGYAVLSDPAKRISHQRTQGTYSDADENGIVDEMRQKYYKNFSRKDPINDQYNFSYKLFKEHYQKVEAPKAEYQKYEGQNQQYYARKDEVGEKPWKQIGAASASLIVILAAYYYTNQ